MKWTAKQTELREVRGSDLRRLVLDSIHQPFVDIPGPNTSRFDPAFNLAESLVLVELQNWGEGMLARTGGIPGCLQAKVGGLALRSRTTNQGRRGGPLVAVGMSNPRRSIQNSHVTWI